ncbi:hypothetical protein Aph02nite_77310 [Actinoplanes philippinensis]|uniref:Pvc16 N-terminal domain-containing protein n=1 Tax=Actinoplanes philippinensis TaxID=35752 RepID=A0A1I2HH22_9ACTN|nr:DUF4255 domain-containing protein [Actinoplanes philippinensis]GIE81781.1 hypothetical protein Aph02nite_77310 [Actinoplanes philippinensis]SFF28723.1 Protein of unknown function [Actinoplanes philippinensis]
MINEVDEALRGLIRRDALPAGTGEVVFDAPNRDWAARRNAPTVDVYLYDIREDTGRRERGMIAVRDAADRIVRHQRPPRWFRLSYLVTAWTKRPEDEHRLLSAVLTCLLRHEALPAEVLGTALTGLGASLPLSVAVPVEGRSVPDVWSALDGELKPSLDVTVTLPFPVVPEYPAGPPVLEPTVAIVRDLGARS